MELPNDLLAQSVEEGKIYFFRDTCPIGVKGHMHVCIKIHEKVYIFSSCTTQMATVRRRTALMGISLETYPCFKKDEVNKFDADLTFINCNEVYECTNDEFSGYLANQSVIPFDGVIDADGMAAIAKGVKLSKTVAKEIQDLF